MTRRIILWTVPRSVSTAFERALIEHPDTSVHHEPFTVPWYFGPERISERYPDADRPDATFAATVEALMNDRSPLVVVKAMAYCAVEALDALPLDAFVHAALIRHPARTVPSLWRGSHDSERTGWSWFDEREVGFDALETVLAAAEEASGVAGTIVDADDLLADPPGVMETWCERVGLRWVPNMLRWVPGPVESWATWPGWHDTAAQSDGLRPRPRSPIPAVDSELAPIVARALPAYERLAARRLRVAEARPGGSDR